jgi:hypothetical protein
MIDKSLRGTPSSLAAGARSRERRVRHVDRKEAWFAHSGSRVEEALSRANRTRLPEKPLVSPLHSMSPAGRTTACSPHYLLPAQATVHCSQRKS